MNKLSKQEAQKLQDLFERVETEERGQTEHDAKF